MLSSKTLYAIYLLHQAGKLCQLRSGFSSTLVSIEDETYLDQLRLRGYLVTHGCITRDLDNDSLLSLLVNLGTLIDPLPISLEEKQSFPRTLSQFNRCFKLWQARLM